MAPFRTTTSARPRRILLPVVLALLTGVVGVVTTAAPGAAEGSRSTASQSGDGRGVAATDAAASATGQTGCIRRPSACGYPDSSTTGVTPGSVLRKVPQQVSSGPGWHYDPRGWITIDGDGVVVSNLDVRVSVEISGTGVTFRNSRVQVTGESWGVGLKHSHGATITGNDIYSPAATGPSRLLVGIKDVYGDATGTKVLRNDISHTSSGVQTHEGLIQGNYIHDMGFNAGDHLNGTTSNGSTVPLSIIGNTVLNDYGQTDAISLFQDFGREANRLIKGNLVAGGGYTIYGGANAGAPGTWNIRIIGNRFSRVYFSNSGGYGPLAAWDPSGAGNTFSGNVWDDSLKPVRY